MNISMSFTSLCKGCEETLNCYIYSIYFSLPHPVCSHSVEENIEDAGFNQQEEHQSLTLPYAAAQIREAVAGAENSAGLVLESQLLLFLWSSPTEELVCPSSTIWISHTHL